MVKDIRLDQIEPNSKARHDLEVGIASILDTINRLTALRVSLEFYKDGVWQNAMATVQDTPRDSDGRVLVGWSFVKRIIKMQGGAYFLVGVIAHECAHILQLQMSLCESLLCSGRVIKVELHADFLAGAILSKSKATLPTLDESILVDQWRNIGDTDYGDYNHHGTAGNKAFGKLQAGLCRRCRCREHL